MITVLQTLICVLACQQRGNRHSLTNLAIQSKLRGTLTTSPLFKSSCCTCVHVRSHGLPSKVLSLVSHCLIVGRFFNDVLASRLVCCICAGGSGSQVGLQRSCSDQQASTCFQVWRQPSALHTPSCDGPVEPGVVLLSLSKTWHAVHRLNIVCSAVCCCCGGDRQCSQQIVQCWCVYHCFARNVCVAAPFGAALHYSAVGTSRHS
jgi:hypothetical protein